MIVNNYYGLTGIDEYDSLLFVKHLRISFSDKQIDSLSGLFMDLSKGAFLATFAINYVLPTDFLNLLGLILGGMISMYIGIMLQMEAVLYLQQVCTYMD